MRHFLYRISQCGRAIGTLVKTATDQANADALLKQLRAPNLFMITLDRQDQ